MNRESFDSSRALPGRLLLRPARDADSAGIIALIDLCYSEYPGCILDVEGEEAQLLTPSRAYPGFWVVVEREQVLGTIGCADRRDAEGSVIVEIKKLYLHPRVRGRGLARALVEFVEAWAAVRGAVAVDLWTDSRFLTAHAVYERLGYRPTGKTRELHDVSNTREAHYVKPLAAGRSETTG